MDIRLTLLFSLALALGSAVGTTAAAQTAAAPAGKPVVAVQVDPAGDLTTLYPHAGNIGLALAIVPDPHIPRYRRIFDLQVQALTLGMLNDGYVLDRFAFPWTHTTSGEKDPRAPPPGLDQDAFGLMIFRCDGWRGHVCQDRATLVQGTEPLTGKATRVRAIYLVTDTATWGVSHLPLVNAITKIREHLAGPVASRATDPRRPELLRFPGGCELGDARKTLVVIGPNFSGAMDSIGEHMEGLLGPEVTDLCLVSSMTTESSNPLAGDAYPRLHYVRLAVDDGTKLLRLAGLAQEFGYFDPIASADAQRWRDRKSNVAFLTEASTFGYGVCNPSERMNADDFQRINKFCRDAQTLYFPAAVADIRNGIDQQRERQQTNVQTAVKAALQSEHLTLDVGADNGSEFPENRQSGLTAASQQLALDHVLDQLEQFDPKLVIVVATDVRDRLFLFDQLRQRLPSALLIDLETDVLLAHPDFLHASRGAVTVASANLFVRGGRLFGCERFRGDAKPAAKANGEGDRTNRIRIPLASWALDGQGILADAVSRLYDSGQPRPNQPCILQAETTKKYGARAPVLHVVTLKGLRKVSRLIDINPDSTARYAVEKRKFQRDVTIVHYLSLICCILIVLPWIWVHPLRKANGSTLILAPWKITTGIAVLGAGLWTFAMLTTYGGEDPESGFALVYWSVAILSLAIGGMHQCLCQVQEAGQSIGELPKRHRYAIAGVGLFACLLAATPLFAGYRVPASTLLPTDITLMTRLALDIGQGLAFEVVIALGVVTVLAIMIALATGLCTLQRNNRLLEISGKCRNGEPGARTPQFPAAPVVVLVFFIALIAVPSLVTPLGGPRLTIFGPRASLIATLVLVVTTLGASIFTAIAIHAGRRVRTISAHIGRCVAPPPAPGGTEPPPGEYPGLWPPNEWQPDLFATTPVVAHVSSDIIQSLNEDTQHPWKTLIKEFLGKCDGGQRSNDGRHRRAVYALLASEVSLYRWFVAGAVLCAIASVCAAYLFPLEADALLMWNLLVLVVHALLAGYVATAFERDGVLSNVLCNRPKKAAFSASLFTYVALPFLALGFAIAVSQVPGVVDWGGGLLALLGSIGISL